MKQTQKYRLTIKGCRYFRCKYSQKETRSGT